MKKPQAQQPPQVPQISFVKSPDFKSYYCNNIRISLTSSDFCLMFGLMMPPEGNNTTVEDQCFMRVSPQSLKILASSLNAAIDGWEETFGKLPETPAGLSGEKEIVNAVALLKDRVKKLGEAV